VLRVLWHDDHLVAVDKPSGLQVLRGLGLGSVLERLSFFGI
jgi:23S rRNA-/tRNA-specific pseudouridylate synthase